MRRGADAASTSDARGASDSQRGIQLLRVNSPCKFTHRSPVMNHNLPCPSITLPFHWPGAERNMSNKPAHPIAAAASSVSMPSARRGGAATAAIRPWRQCETPVCRVPCERGDLRIWMQAAGSDGAGGRARPGWGSVSMCGVDLRQFPARSLDAGVASAHLPALHCTALLLCLTGCH